MSEVKYPLWSSLVGKRFGYLTNTFACLSEKKRRLCSENRSPSGRLRLKPFIFQGLQSRQPARLFLGLLRL
jgi:hypothetical protein